MTGIGVQTGRPSMWTMLWHLVRHRNRAFWRTPLAAFFTVAFPLIFLLLFGALLGNELIDGTEVRFAQFYTPSIAVFSAVTASFTSLAISLTVDREMGRLRRLRGTPVPPWLFMTGQIISMVLISMVASLLMVAVGVAAFDVQVVWPKVAAALLTMVLGTLSFCALGVALTAASPSNEATSAVANGIVVPLAFISGIFVVGAELPRWLDVFGSLFPLKHFALAMQSTFNPFEPGLGFAWGHLAVILAWGAGGMAAAVALFTWEPKVATSPTSRRNRPSRPQVTADGAVEVGSRSPVQLVVTQVRIGVLAFVRTRASAFFTLLFPPLLLAIFALVFDAGEVPGRGVSLAQFAAPALGVYGVAVACYADFSERVAFMRDKGVLRRVRGTPLPAWAFILGRMGATVLIALASLVITVAVGMAFFDVEVVPRMFAGVLVSVVLGISTFTALGLALASVVGKAESVPTIANATLLPIAFVSDVFLIGEAPTWMQVVGNVFPLKHFVNAVADGFNPTVPGAGFFPDHLAVMAVWCVVSVALALRFFTWSPHQITQVRIREDAV